MSSDVITLTGLVATIPRHIVTSEGLSITSFRLASTQRRFDRSQERWVDAETNWFSITTFRHLAHHCASSIEKGQRVIVTGKLRVREWDNGERVGTTVEVEAESVGHDLMWGTSTFTRSIMSSGAAPAARRAEGDARESEPERSVPAEQAEVHEGDETLVITHESFPSGTVKPTDTARETEAQLPAPF